MTTLVDKPTTQAGDGTFKNFEGFSQGEINESKFIVRLWNMEEENRKIRDEMRDLMQLVKTWREGTDRCNENENFKKEQVMMIRELDALRKREELREKDNETLREQVELLAQQNFKNQQEIMTLQKENKELKLTLANQEMGFNEDMVKIEVKDQINKEVNTWKEKSRQQETDIREIMKQQQIEHKKHMEKDIVRIIKQKEKIIRNTVQKKMCVIVFGDKEKDIPLKATREREEVKRAKEIITAVVEDGEEVVEQMEEVYRLGHYVKNGARPMKIRFSTQVAANTVLARTGKLAKTEDMNHIWIRSDMNEEERSKLKELRGEARTKNEERTQEQAKSFVWRVVDLKLKKWWLKDSRKEKQQ